MGSMRSSGGGGDRPRDPPKEKIAVEGMQYTPLLRLGSSYLALAFLRVFCCFSTASRTGKATFAISAEKM